MGVRDDLISIVEAGLDSVDGRLCVAKALAENINADDKIAVVAVGKAAPAMLEGALEVVAEQLVSGLLISKASCAASTLLPDCIDCYIGGHPIPNEESLVAGQALIDYVSRLSLDTKLIVLISGGASALVEVLPDNVSLSQLQALNDYLLHSGRDIYAMNRLRQSVSKIKAGRLAQYINAGKTRSYIMSDVGNNELSIIGSGLLAPSYHQIDLDDLPKWVRQCCLSEPELPVDSDEEFNHIEQTVIADLDQALSAMEFKAVSSDYDAFNHGKTIEGDVKAFADRVADYLIRAPIGIHIWGGETTVDINEPKGVGGRNTYLALLLAEKLRGFEGIVLATVATDADDGNSDCAGALVDGETLDEANISSELVASALSKANSAELLGRAHALLHFAKGRSNVADLLVAIKY